MVPQKAKPGITIWPRLLGGIDTKGFTTGVQMKAFIQMFVS